MESNYKVRLIPISSVRFGDATSISDSQVVFEVTPTFTENRAIDYAAVTPVHMPGSIQMYRSTGSRTFEIGAQLISRNGSDAAKNRRYLQTLRGWTMPYFGITNTLSTDQQITRSNLDNGFTLEDQGIVATNRIQAVGVQLRGAPPDVLYLYAYSMGSTSPTGERLGDSSNISRVPVVVTSLNISYPSDVDYIPVTSSSGTIEPFPVKMEISVSLVETHSPREYENFSLDAFKAGTLVNF